MRQPSVIVAAIAAASCYHSSPPIYLPSAPADLARATGIPEADYSGVDHVNPGQGHAWRHVVAEARSVVSSPEFQNALMRFAKMDPKVGAPFTTGADVFSAYSGTSATLGQVVTQYVLSATSCDDAGQTASTLLVNATPMTPHPQLVCAGNIESVHHRAGCEREYRRIRVRSKYRRARVDSRSHERRRSILSGQGPPRRHEPNCFLHRRRDCAVHVLGDALAANDPHHSDRGMRGQGRDP